MMGGAERNPTFNLCRNKISKESGGQFAWKKNLMRSSHIQTMNKNNYTAQGNVSSVIIRKGQW